MSIESHLTGMTDKLAFLSLDEISSALFGEVPADFAVPVFVTDIRALAGGAEGFSTRQLASAMLFMIGIDPVFRFTDSYCSFLKTSIDHPEAFATELGMQKHEAGAYKEALIYLRAATTLAPDAVYTHFNVAQMAVRFASDTSDLELARELRSFAEQELEQVLERSEAHAAAHLQLAQLLLLRDQIALAQKHLAFAVQSAEPEIHAHALRLQRELGAEQILLESEQAIEEGDFQRAFDALTELDLHDLPKELAYQIHYAIGFSAKALGEIEGAIEAYTQALTINNQDDLLLADLGMSYALLGDFDQALELYLAAQELVPSSAALWNNIAIIYLNLGNITEAKRAIGEALALESNEEIIDETVKLIRAMEEQRTEDE